MCWISFHTQHFLPDPNSIGRSERGLQGSGIGAILVVLLMLWASAPSIAAEPDPQTTAPPLDKRVLILYPSGKGAIPVLDLMVDTLLDSLRTGGVDWEKIHVEYLELNRYPGGKHRQQLTAMMRSRYEGLQTDVVICLGEPSLRFLLKEEDWLAPDAKVIAFGSKLYAEAATHQRQIILETLKIDYRGTLQLALALFPRTKRVLILQGAGEIDLEMGEDLRRELAPWQGLLQIDDTQTLNSEEMAAKLSTLPKDTIVFALSITRDGSTKAFIPLDALARLAESCNAPVFTVFENYVGATLGGSVSRFENEAIAVADKALGILRGTVPFPDLATTPDGSSLPIFDWTQLKRWGVDPGVLPDNTLFLNKPPSPWEQHRTGVVAILSTLTLLLCVMFGLLLLNRRLAMAKKTVMTLNATLAGKNDDLVATEKELHYSENRFRSVLRTLPDLVWLKDTEGVYLSCNASFERLFGAREADIVGKTDHDFLNRELADFFRENDRKAMAADKASRNEEEVVFADDGHRELLETIKTPLYDLEGKLIGVLGIARDITARKRAEEELRQERDRIQHYLDTVESIVLALDAEGRISLINRKGCEVLGWSESELVGRVWFEQCLPQPEGRHDIYPYFLKRIKGELENTDYLENCVLTKSGEARVIAWHNALLRDEQGRITGTLSAGEDITLHKRTESQLQAAQRMAKIGNWELNLTDNTLTWSEEVFRIFEIEQSRFGATYEAFLNAIHPEDRASVNEAYTESLRTRTPYKIDHRLLMKDGRIKHVLEHCESEFGAGGQPLISRGTVQDITERKLAEEALRESEQHFRALFEKAGDGIIYISHDGEIVRINEAFARLHGYSIAEMRNIKLQELNVDDLSQIFPEQVRRLMSGEELRFEVRHYHRDGHIFDLEVSASQIFFRKEKHIVA
ncbi:MAG: PAS domain S-box protein, partial [Planctomycetes bacterium]|nr:PAS domain S-box protein [Planctomycetota bacterium]